METLKPVRGTYDLLPDELRHHRFIIETAREIANRFAYEEMATPIMEFSEVFKRTLGETSDVVSKEMYTFEDRGGDYLTLRPEGTAGIARAFISEGLKTNAPLRLFYNGPMFRHERPQKGRQRQFHQLGVELIGVASIEADVEVISMAHLLLKALGLADNVELQINSIGDTQSRDRFRQELVLFLKDKKSQLSEDSQKRLETNPLRILDSKDDGDQKLLKGAPQLTHFLTTESQTLFADLKQGLNALEIPYKENPRLVRGLDYYRYGVFEFKALAGLGAQDTLLAGGRYDRLIEFLGGPATPGVGWACGIERLRLVCDQSWPKARPAVVIPLSEAAESAALKLSYELRSQGFTVASVYSGNLSKRLKKASKLNAFAALLLGDDELKGHAVTLKLLDLGQQEVVKRDQLAARLMELVGPEKAPLPSL